MNYELLRRHASTRRVSTRADWFFVATLIVALVLCITAVSALMIGLIVRLAHALR